MTAPSVRPYAPADEPRCAQIMARATRQAFPWAPAPEPPDDAFRAVTEEEELMVAESDGRIIGFAAIYAPARFLRHLYVEPDCQRQGAGRALLAEVVRRLGMDASLKCVARNTRARAFYRANGWVEDAVIGGADEHGPWLWIRAAAQT